MTSEQVAIAWALFAIAFSLCMFGAAVEYSHKRAAQVLYTVAAVLMLLLLVRIVPLLWR